MISDPSTEDDQEASLEQQDVVLLSPRLQRKRSLDLDPGDALGEGQGPVFQILRQNSA